MEQWLDVVGYEGVYEVSNIGNVRTAQRAPCNDYHFIDEVANFCDEQYCTDLCDPTECWLRVFEQIEKEK